MELDDNDHIRMAQKLESEMLAKIKFTSAYVIDLDRLLCDTFIRQCPKSLDYHNRRNLVRVFNVIAKEIYGNSVVSPVVEEYGSFVMDMFDEKSDLDLSINFNGSIEVSRKEKISTLHKFKNKLLVIQREGLVVGLQAIWSARVPIIKVTDSGTGIECDLSVDNRDGITKSHIIHAISGIDERFRQLSFLMKSWAKAHDINSAKDSTLSSISIVSLVAFHLQTRNPPILPPFSILLKDGDDPASVANVVETYFNYGKQNKESLAMLFITLLVKLASVEKLWQKGFCVSLYEGSWILKSWNRRCAISVEDFIDRSQNVARAVRTKEVKTIYRCIHKSLDYLTQFLNGQSQENNLMDVLFGKHTAATLEVGVTSYISENKNNLPTLQNPHPPNKRHSVQNPHPPNKRRLVENQFLIPSEKKIVQGLQGTEPQSGVWKKQGLDETVRNVLASFTPPVSYQPPLAISSTNNKVNHNYSLGTAPYFPLNPVASERYYNPSMQSHLVSSQSSQGLVGTVHQKAVAPNPCLPSIHSHLPQVAPVSYQPPLAISSTNNKVNHNYSLGTAPYFPLNPVTSERYYNSSMQSHLVSSQSSQGLVGTVHQKAVAPNPCLPSIHSHLPQVAPVSYQSPLAISSTNNKVNHNYSLGTAPYFPLNPVASERYYNPSMQSHLVSSQSSQGLVGTVHQKAVAPNPCLPSIHSHLPQVGHNPYRERAFYNHRSDPFGP